MPHKVESTTDDGGKVVIRFTGEVTFRMADLWRFKEMDPSEITSWVEKEWPAEVDPFNGAVDLWVEPTGATIDPNRQVYP